ncbi:MAG: hypothetical protein WBD58_21425 [Geitlerinemataceae cyanobacterium]
MDSTIVKNDSEYQNTLAWLHRFEQSVAELDENDKLKAEPRRWQLHRDSYQSQVDELKEEIAEFERLINCDRLPPIEILIENLNKLPDALIKARIAAKMSQKELADLLEIDEKRIKECEDKNYQCASFSEILDISFALGLEFKTAVMQVDFEQIEAGQESAKKWREKRLNRERKIS